MTVANQSHKKLGNIHELADMLGIGIQRAYKLARDGEFDDFIVRVGERQYRFRFDGAENYINRGGNRSVQAEATASE